MPRKTSARLKTSPRNTFRIIAGEWRGRRLKFQPAAGVRPTPDRVRETLFNWLQPVMGGARCLDLFAGSGALGLEALSRGAREVTFVERSPEVADCIRAQLALLERSAHVHALDAFAFLARNTDTFDIVFLDPPYGTELMSKAFDELVVRNLLRPGARVYVETAPGALEAALPKGWRLLRRARAGQVEYGLAASDPASHRRAGVE